MAAYQGFTSARATPADLGTLLATLRGLDATAGVTYGLVTGIYTVKKATDWTAPQVAAVQKAIDQAPASSPELTAQAQIDAMPIATQALLLALIDALNTIRAALPVPLPAITPAAAMAAVRTKAATI